MYDFTKITLGVVTTRRDMFPVAVARANNVRIMERIHALLDSNPKVNVVYSEEAIPEGMICEIEDTNVCAQYFKDKKVDALFVIHANFGSEEAVSRLCRQVNVPVLLWGPRDGVEGSPEGFRDGDIQCGLFASTRALLRHGIKFTYFENCWLDSPVVEKEVDKFIRAASVVKAMRNMGVLQIGSRPRQFQSVKVNEAELMERFGVQITPIESSTILKTEYENICATKKEEIEKNAAIYKEEYDLSALTEEQIFGMSALIQTIVELAERYDCNTVACECWNVPRALTGIQGCFAFGILEDMGITVSCECDINGAISSAIARAAAMGDSAVFFADVTARHPLNDNAELMWHCGRFPKSLSRMEKPVASNMGQMLHELKPGVITMIRFDGTGGKYYLFADEGKGVDGPATQGAYVWLEVNDWVKWEKKLMYGPYIHHMAGVYGKYREAVEEACRYLDVTFDCADITCEY